MKKNSKVLVTSLVTIMASFSVLAGATYALFTSESKVNVAINSGKVEVVATADNLKLFSGKWDDASSSYISVEQQDFFSNGGTAVLSNDKGSLNIARLSAMDRVQFDLTIENLSDIKAIYQTVLTSDNGSLFNHLDVRMIEDYDGITPLENWEVYNGASDVTSWKEINPGEDPTKLTISIGLPEDSDAQGLSCNIQYSVVAVQGNAHVEEADKYIYTANDLRLFAEEVNAGNTFAGKVVKLMSDIDLNNQNWTPIGLNGDVVGFSGTFDGNGMTISNLKVEQLEAKYQSAGLFGSIRNAVLKNFTIENAYINSRTTGIVSSCGAAVVAGSSQFASTIDNVDVVNAEIYTNRYAGAVSGYFQGTITNCDVTDLKVVATPDDFTGSYDNGDKVGGIIGYANTSATLTSNTIDTFELVAYRDIGGILGAGQAELLMNNKATNGSVTADQSLYYGDKTANTGAIVGRNLSGGTLDASNTSSNVDINFVQGYPITNVNLSTLAADEEYLTASSGIYKFSGSYAGDILNVKVQDSSSTVTLDFENATLDNLKQLRVSHYQIADGLHTIVTNGEFNPRVGGITVNNAVVSNGVLSVGARSTTISINEITSKAIDVDGSNCTINVSNCNVTTDSLTNLRYDGNNNDKSFYILATNYDLTLTSNNFTSLVKDTISLNGRAEWDMADFVNNNAANFISEDKIVNSVKLIGNNLSAARRAFYMWGDHTYGSNYVFNNTSTVADLKTVNIELIKSLLNENTAVSSNGFVGFGGLYLDRATCEAL